MSLFSRNSLLGGQATSDYANTPFMDTTAKKSVVQDGANANLLLNSRDRNTGTFANQRRQPFNDFTLQKQFPILQGQINSIKVDEIVFPIPPNITPFNNCLLFYKFSSVGNINAVAPTGTYGNIFKIEIPPGFYTGEELASIIDAELSSPPAPLAPIPFLPPKIVGGNPLPFCVYTKEGTFQFYFDLNGATMNSPAPYDTPVAGWGVAPCNTPPGYSPANVSALLTQNAGVTPESMGLIWSLGFNNYFSNERLPDGWFRALYLNPATNYTQPFTGSDGNPIFLWETGVAPLLYTKYVDITSDVLTQYQELTDTSTDTTNPNHIICRLYIADEISKPQTSSNGKPVLPGTIYTTIHRQFKNPKILRWNGMNSVDRIDIRLIDDLGRLLWYRRTGADDFQITLSAVEI